jgi:hypothetical protein
MAKLSKDPRLAVRTPEWASFFTPGQYVDFVQLVCSTMAKHGLRAHLDDGVAVIRRPDKVEERLGLLNLAQMCGERERSEWPHVIGEFFENMGKMGRDPEALVHGFESFEATRDKIKVRLHPEDYLQHPHAAHLCLRKIVDGISALLVCDLGHVNVSLPAETARDWGMPMDELFALGAANVRKADKRLQEAKGRPTGGYAVDMLTSGSNYAATHVLFLEDYLQGGTAYGALVGVPSREVIFRHIIRDKSVLEAFSFMHKVIEDYYKRGPGSISRDIYWWRAGALQRVPTAVVGEKLVVAPGDEFERVVFESMMKEN